VPIDGIDALHRHLSRWPAGRALPLYLLRGLRRLSVDLTPREVPQR
jgi:hypothetical protein